jgi:hypothetical protein
MSQHLQYNYAHSCDYYNLHEICEADALDKKTQGIENPELIENCAFVDTAYQMDLLEIFGVPSSGMDVDMDLVRDELVKLYDRLKNNTLCVQLMTAAAAQIESTHLTEGLMVLYSFQYMHLMHLFVSSLSADQGLKIDVSPETRERFQAIFKLVTQNALGDNAEK